MEFKNKQYDGPFEIVMVELQIEDQVFRGILYFPSSNFKRPHPIIVYFHGFPQIISLQEIAQNYQYLLEKGYAFLLFNFRGYNFSDGTISIKNQVTDALKIIEFLDSMVQKQIIIGDDINILAHDFGGYVALILCSKINLINKLLMINPILDLKRHVKNVKFRETLAYLNRFLPGYIKDIRDIDRFIDITDEELVQDQFNIDFFINKIKIRDMKVIIGENDKITPISEVKRYFNSVIKNENISIIKDMDHDCFTEENFNTLHEEIQSFFTIKLLG